MRSVRGAARVPTRMIACDGSSTSPCAGKDAPGGQCLAHASIASAAADDTSGTRCVTSRASRSWPRAAPSAGTYSSSSAMSATISSNARVSSAAPRSSSSSARRMSLLVLSRSTTAAHRSTMSSHCRPSQPSPPASDDIAADQIRRARGAPTEPASLVRRVVKHSSATSRS